MRGTFTAVIMALTGIASAAGYEPFLDAVPALTRRVTGCPPYTKGFVDDDGFVVNEYILEGRDAHYIFSDGSRTTPPNGFLNTGDIVSLHYDGQSITCRILDDCRSTESLNKKELTAKITELLNTGQCLEENPIPPP